jgi:hypothetical protein
MRFHGAPQRAKIERRFDAQRDKSARTEDFQSSNYLGGRQTQIQRGDGHADFEAAIFEQNVIHGERQQGDQEIAFREAEAQQLFRQRRGQAVELAPGDGAAAVCAEDGNGLRAELGPLRYHSMQQVAIGKISLVIVEGKLRHLHRFTQSCS